MPLALRALILLLLALIPAAGVQLWMERQAREVRAAQVADQAMRLALLVSAQQVRTIEGAQQVLAAVAAHDAVRALRPNQECDDFLRRLVAAYPRYTIANVFGPDGFAICTSSAGPMRGVSVADRWYFQEAVRTRNFVVGNYAIGRSTDQASLHLAAPFLGEDGQVAAVMVLGLSVEWLVKELQALQLPDGSSSTITDREGVILARSREPERFVGQRIPASAMELMRRPTAGITDMPALDGVRRIAAYIPLHEPPAGLFITLGLDANEALAEAAQRDRLNASLIVGSLLLTFVVALLAFGAAIQSPVRALLAAAQRWGRQDWGARVGPIGGGQEFRRLGAAFDAMAQEVQAREAARAASETRLAAVLDLSPQAVFTTDAEGQITWLNRWWHVYTGTAQGGAPDAAWLAALHPEDRAPSRAAWEESVRTAQQGRPAEYVREQRILHAAEGEHRWHVTRARPLRDAGGAVTGWVGVAVDTHEIRLARAEAEEAAERLHATYENAPVGLALLDRELRFVAANRRLAAIDGVAPGAYRGRRIDEVNPQVAAIVTPLMRSVAETGEAVEDVEIAGVRRVFLCAYRAVRGLEGEVVAVTCAVLDITARKRAEEAERLLSREVDHRAKNALAVVRSLARLSLAEAEGDPSAAVEALEGRISALARVHTVLARERWVGADLEELVRAELEPYDGNVTVDGPPLRLAAAAAQPLTMIVHELATNAAKYGALAAPDGQVSVTWTGGPDGVSLSWREAGGPRLSGPPQRTGFGSRLVEANITGPLGGEAEFDWRPDGLEVRLRIAREALAGF